MGPSITDLPEEILAMILEECDPCTVLVSQRLGLKWRTVVQTLPSLRRKVWLKPHESPEQLIKWLPRSRRSCTKNMVVAANPLIEKCLGHVLSVGASAETGASQSRNDERRAQARSSHSNTPELDILAVTTRNTSENAICLSRSSLEVLFTTVRNLTAVLEKADENNSSWRDMIVFQPNIFAHRNLMIEYQRVGDMTDGELDVRRHEKMHLIDTGRWDHSPTIGELVEVVLRKHRDVYGEQ